MRCSGLRARQLALRHSRPVPRHQLAQAEDWQEPCEGEAEAQYANSCQGGEEGVGEEAKESHLQRRKTEPGLRVRVQMVCRDLSKTS